MIRSALVAALMLGSAAPAVAAPDTLSITIMGTTDVHGHVYPTNYFGDKGDEPFGLARAYTLIKQIRAQSQHTLLLDSGDSLQGTPLTYHSARIATASPNPMVAAYNYMGYDAFAVGNHEYNYGLPYLGKARTEARYPFLSGNVYKHGTKSCVYTPYVIKDVGGAKVAIVGFTTPGVAVWDRRHVAGVQDFGDIHEAAARWIPEAKKKGADVVVVIIHSGLGAPYDATFGGYSEAEGIPEENVCAKLAERFPAIDAVLLGHSHKDLPQLLHKGTLMTQAKKWGECLAVVDLRLVKSGKKWKVATKTSTTLSTKGIAPDPGLLWVTKPAHQATLAYVNTVVARSTAEWTAKTSRVEDTPIMDLINTVQMAKTGAQLSAASVFNASARLPKGQLSVADIASLYVYENTLTKVAITGKQLKDYLENSASFFEPYKPGGRIFDDRPAYNHDMVSGVAYTIDVTKPVGERIGNLEYKGKPVADEQVFSMALNSYRQNGGGGYTMLKTAPVQTSIYTEIRELMIDWVKEHKVVDPKQVFHRNWHLLPEGVVGADGVHYAL